MTMLAEIDNATAIIDLLTIGALQSLQTDKIYKFAMERVQLMVKCRAWWRGPVALCCNKAAFFECRCFDCPNLGANQLHWC